MALSAAVAAAAIKSAFGYIGRQALDPDPNNQRIKPTAVRDKIADRLGVTGDSNRLSLLAHVNQAQRVADAGADMQDNQYSTAVIGAPPLDRSLDPGMGRYGYRVIIVITDPSTISSWERQEIVYSPTPLSPADTLSQAFQQFERTRTDIDTDPKANATSASTSIDGRIISAGRAP